MCNKCRHQQSSRVTFETHNNPDINIDTNGTYLQGCIDADYKRLVETFGEPHTADEYKSDAGWDIVFFEGQGFPPTVTVATIYNYKDGKNYLGAEGDATEDIRDWHIGGFNYRAVELVKKALFGG